MGSILILSDFFAQSDSPNFYGPEAVGDFGQGDAAKFSRSGGQVQSKHLHLLVVVLVRAKPVKYN